MYKALVVIIDGLGDRPSRSLDGRTPLEAASTPIMDKLVAGGSCGYIDPLAPGLPVDTHTGSAALMGMARKELLKLARGPVEAAGVGIEVNPGDILLRANFATLEDDGMTIIDRRAGRIREGTGELAQVLQDVVLGDGITASVFPATQHRAVVRLRGYGLCPDITDTDPGSMPHAMHILPSRALDPGNDAAWRTAEALNDFLAEAYRRLEVHPLNRKLSLPANALLTRGAGVASQPRDILNRLELRAAVISGERTLHGLGQLLGFSVIFREEFTAGADTDLGAKFRMAREAFRTHEVVYVHIKATDIYSHSKDARGKCAFIEKIDAAMEAVLDDNLVIAVAADHSTDSTTGRHCGDPVPFLLNSPGGRVDGVECYAESCCSRGGLGRISATGLLLSVLDAMGRLTNYHPFDAEFVDVIGRG